MSDFDEGGKAWPFGNKKRIASRSAAPRCSDEFRRGAEMAADIARSYNRCTTHPYDLGDCILSKLNLLAKKRIRPNSLICVKDN